MGFASRALRLVSTWASGLGLSPIRLYIDPGNLPSQRVALAAGFVTDEDDTIRDDEGEPGDRVFIL
jgi:RimJ/RimL family protein N-acetyltransferase